MFWLSTSTIVRLRDQLRAAGQRGMVAPSGNAGERTPADEQLLEDEYGPLLEAMHLMMSADGDVSIEEREVLRGALANLAGDALDGEIIEQMIETAAAKEKSEGRPTRFAAVVESLSKDHARAEVAFVLAAAIAFADNAIADEENDALDTLAEGLGIDEARADTLLDAIEKDLR